MNLILILIQFVCFQKIKNNKKYKDCRMFLSAKLCMAYMPKQTQERALDLNDNRITTKQCWEILILKRISPIQLQTVIIYQWIARTVMVNNNDIDEAMLLLNGIMQREGMTKRWRLTRTYEKPTWVGMQREMTSLLISLQARNRVNYEKCRAIYDEDMKNKVKFVLRKNRVDPYPGC